MDSINHEDSVTFSRNILRANVCKISAKIVNSVIEISLFLHFVFILNMVLSGPPWFVFYMEAFISV